MKEGLEFGESVRVIADLPLRLTIADDNVAMLVLPRLSPLAPEDPSDVDVLLVYPSAFLDGLISPHSVFTAVDNQGDHGLFPMGTACVDQPIIDYFLSGNLPKKKVTICDGLPLPDDDRVYENWTALGPNGKPKAGNKKPQSAAVVEADKVAKDMIAQQEADFMILQSMNAG